MSIESMGLWVISSFLVTLVSIYSLAPLALKVGLTDAPSSRKRHDGHVPLVGGIAIFTCLTLAVFFLDSCGYTPLRVNGHNAQSTLFWCCGLLVIIGVLDDRFNLGVFVRILSEVAVAVVLIEALDLQVRYLGDLLNLGVLRLSDELAYPFTVIAIFGVMNAFNMLDGMDGLVTCLVVTTLLMFHAFTATPPTPLSLTVLSSLAAFLISNLNFSRFIPKTFLGDAGSKLLGFIVVCLLLAAASSQLGDRKLVEPVTTLFLIAVPLYDMCFVSIRRLVSGKSPFKADRSHIHHLMCDLRLSERGAVIFILCIHSTVAFIGLVLHRAQTPAHFQFAIFLGCFAAYCVLLSQLWSAVAKSHRGQR